MKKFLGSLTALALVFAAGNTQAVLLSDLVAGQTITAGDKVFDEWDAFWFTSDFSDIDLANIDVTALALRVVQRDLRGSSVRLQVVQIQILVRRGGVALEVETSLLGVEGTEAATGMGSQGGVDDAQRLGLNVPQVD